MDNYANGLTKVPAQIGVVALCPLVFKVTKNYVSRKIKDGDEESLLSCDPDIQAEVVTSAE